MREGDAACLGKIAHLGDRLALEPDGQRSDRIHVRLIERASAVLEHLDQSGLVQRRISVGRAGEARDAAIDRCFHLRFERRLVLDPGLAYKATLESEMEAAIAGGVTSL